jgi:hypothetical protein
MLLWVILMWMLRRTGARNIPDATHCCQYRMIGVQTSAKELIKGRIIEDPNTLGSWSLSSMLIGNESARSGLLEIMRE